MASFHYLIKYIIIGDSAVGKSNILLRFTNNQFTEYHNLTIGLEFGANNIQIEDTLYRLQVWDTAGQEKFLSIARAYYQNSACAIIVYDISKRDSFNHIEDWIQSCQERTTKTVTMVLVGNKSDLEEQREISFEEGRVLAEKHDMWFFEVSAKTGRNISAIFELSAKSIGEKIKDYSIDWMDDTCGIKKGLLSSLDYGEDNIKMNGNNNHNNNIDNNNKKSLWMETEFNQVRKKKKKKWFCC